MLFMLVFLMLEVYVKYSANSNINVQSVIFLTNTYLFYLITFYYTFLKLILVSK